MKTHRINALIAIPLCLLLWLPARAQDNARTPVQWPANGHYYQVVETPAAITWDDAQAYATAHGGYLATITSEEENNFVFSLTDDPSLWRLTASGTFSKGPWLGGYQPPGSQEPAGGWQWVNNEGPITANKTYTNWSPGEPNDDGDENRLSYFVRKLGQVRNPTWSDSNNNRNPSVSFIVEYDSEASAKAAPVGAIVAGPAASTRPGPDVPSATERRNAALNNGTASNQPGQPSPGNGGSLPPLNVQRAEPSVMPPPPSYAPPEPTQNTAPASASQPEPSSSIQTTPTTQNTRAAPVQKQETTQDMVVMTDRFDFRHTASVSILIAVVVIALAALVYRFKP